MIGDITPLKNSSGSDNSGGRVHQVVSGGTPPAINAGEPVSKTLGNEYVVTNATSAQVVGTNYLAGISLDNSTETASLNGQITVQDIDPKDTWLIAPAVAATYGQGATQSQSTYNALVGTRVLIQKVSGVYTILAADSTNNGCVIENLTVADYPGKVAFSFRAGLFYLA